MLNKSFLLPNWYSRNYALWFIHSLLSLPRKAAVLDKSLEIPISLAVDYWHQLKFPHVQDWTRQSSGPAGVYGLSYFPWLSWVYLSFRASCHCSAFCCRDSSAINFRYLLNCFCFWILFFLQHASFIAGDKKKLTTMVAIFLQ